MKRKLVAYKNKTKPKLTKETQTESIVISY